jgi:hypothetical protein
MKTKKIPEIAAPDKTVAAPLKTEPTKPVKSKTTTAIEPVKNTGTELSSRSETVTPVKPIQDSAKRTVKSGPALVCKSGATDLRRGINKLDTNAKINVMLEKHLADGDMIAFANKPKTTVKITRRKDDGTALLTKKFDKPIDWPKYQAFGTPGYVVTLTGKDKGKFLDDLNIPETL